MNDVPVEKLVVVQEVKEISVIKKILNSDKQCLYARMSGSGSCYYGIKKSKTSDKYNKNLDKKTYPVIEYVIQDK